MSAGVHARAERTCHSEMSQYKSQIEDVTRDVSDVTHRKRGLRFEKSHLVESCRPKKKVDFRLFAEALRQVSYVVWADGNVVIERLCLSRPYVEKPFNWMVIKCFVPELRSRKCFSCFGIPMWSYMSYEHSMNISRIHILAVSWTWTVMLQIYILSSTDALFRYIINFQRG